MGGSELLRITGERAKAGHQLQPQMLRVADCLNNNDPFFGLLMPRRSSKTTSIFATMLGRLEAREDYLVAYTMLTRAFKARQRFMADIVRPVEFLFRDPKTSPWKIGKQAGNEYIEHRDTGSRMQIVAPRGEVFRSDAWDVIVLDEAGEADADMSDDVLEGSLATMDTRENSQLIAAGTAGKFREGNLLWDFLQRGRAGQAGILEYAAPPEAEDMDLLDWNVVRELVLESHPGIGTLTTIEKMQGNFELKPEVFPREYLSLFGKVGSQEFIKASTWAALGTGGNLPTPPKHFRLGFAVHPLQTSASIVAVWRVDGKAHVIVLATRAGTQWVAPKIKQLWTKYRIPMAYDSGQSVNGVVAEVVGRMRPAPKLVPQSWPQVSTADAALIGEIETGNLQHWNQPDLDAAVRHTTKRATKESKRWGFGRDKPDNDITSVEAIAVALRVYDDAPQRAPLRIVRSDVA